MNIIKIVLIAPRQKNAFSLLLTKNDLFVI